MKNGLAGRDKASFFEGFLFGISAVLVRCQAGLKKPGRMTWIDDAGEDFRPGKRVKECQGGVVADSTAGHKEAAPN